MKMKKSLKNFIEENIEMIENEEFEVIYSDLDADFRYTLIGDFTEALIKAGIDPAKYMKEIPPHYLGGTSLRSYTIPNNITAIGEYAFSGYNGLTGVVIPSTVTSICAYAFRYCSELESITYLGTIDQWKEVKKLPGWKKDSSIKKIICADGITNPQ
jgi:hypothetical protein